MNRKYHIRRRDMLSALGLPKRIPPGQTGCWKNVVVRAGWWGEHELTLPVVVLEAGGVAKRIQVMCPECGTMMRFCGLQQHAGSKTCRTTARDH